MSRRKSGVDPAPVKNKTAETVEEPEMEAKAAEETVQVPTEAAVQLLEECRVVHKRLRLRKEPNLGADVLKVLPIGTPVTVDLHTWHPDGLGVWMRAQTDGAEGWVDTRYLARIKEG